MEMSAQSYAVPALRRGTTSGNHWTGNHVRRIASLNTAESHRSPAYNVGPGPLKPSSIITRALSCC